MSTVSLISLVQKKDKAAVFSALHHRGITHDQETLNKCFQEACKVGSLEIARILLPFADPSANQSLALLWAAESGYSDIVRFLIPLSDPKDRDNQPLRWASSNGHTECVRLLLPHSDPRASGSEALYWACRGKYQEIFEMLYPVSDADIVFNMMQKRHDLPKGAMDMLEKYLEIDRTKKLLQSAMPSVSCLPRAKKI